MDFIDAFSGIGGFHHAIKMVDSSANCVNAIEIDDKAQKNYYENFNIHPLSDITKLDLEKLPGHDFLFGGFPCQSFSRNGRYYNFNQSDVLLDDRTFLFNYLYKILQIHSPDFFLFENVKGLITIDNGSVFTYVSDILKNSGYYVTIKLIDSADYGVPQQRKRVIFAGSKYSKPQIPNIIQRNTCVKNVMESTVPDKYHMVNYWKNRKITLQTPEMCNHTKNKGDSRYDALMEIVNTKIKPNEMTHKITPLGIVYGETPSGTARQGDKVYSSLGISPTLATFATPCFDYENEYRVLTPKECARLQGFPEKHILPSSDSVAYKQFGNSITVPVMAKMIQAIINTSKKNN